MDVAYGWLDARTLVDAQVRRAHSAWSVGGFHDGSHGCCIFQIEVGTASMQNIIEIKHVTAYRGSTRVFNDLSLDIATGCQTAILGPNGAGKSTLLKLLSRDIYPVQRQGSSIRVFGQERWNIFDLRAHFGIVSTIFSTSIGATCAA